MIQLKQNSHDVSGLHSIIQKNGNVVLKLNTTIINDDINRLKQMIPKAINKNDKSNIDNIIKYLTRLKYKVDAEDNYQMTWVFEKWKIYGYPLDIKEFKQYNIKASDYIEVGKSKAIRIDYHNVYEIMAFEMMYRDLGYNIKEIEEDLKDIGVSVISSDKVLEKYLKEQALDCSKYFKISNSPYASNDGKLSWDYFYTAMNEGKAFQTRRYKEPVERSVNVAIDLIAKRLMENFINKKLKFQICSLTEDGMYFMIDDVTRDDIKEMIESAVVRAFGRKFEVIPKIEIF